MSIKTVEERVRLVATAALMADDAYTLAVDGPIRHVFAAEVFQAHVAWALATDPRSNRDVSQHWDGAEVRKWPDVPQSEKDRAQLFLEIVRIMDELLPETEVTP